MKVAMMQPAFLPWQGFFALIYHAEVFVVLDDFQFSVQSYHQRNRMFIAPGQVGWYTVPVEKQASFKMPLNQTRIDESGPWRKKMIRRIQQNYGKTPFYGEIFPWVESWLGEQAETLAAQNVAFIRWVMGMFGWKRDLRFSSSCPSEETRSHRVLELLRWCDASRYYSAHGSFGYMQEDGVFPVPEIELKYQEFTPHPYSQAGSPDTFTPDLSVLDALFNIGATQTAQLIVEASGHWLNWDERMRHEPDNK